jgi:hypothetical protein
MSVSHDGYADYRKQADETERKSAIILLTQRRVLPIQGIMAEKTI